MAVFVIKPQPIAEALCRIIGADPSTVTKITYIANASPHAQGEQIITTHEVWNADTAELERTVQRWTPAEVQP